MRQPQADDMDAALNPVETPIDRNRSVGQSSMQEGQRLKHRAIVGVIGSMDLVGAGRNWAPVLISNMEKFLTLRGGAMSFYERMLPEQQWVPHSKMRERLLEDKIDAVIFNAIHYSLDEFDAFAQDWGRCRLPVACITWEPQDVYMPHCYYGNLDAGFVAASHVLKSGYRRILFPAGFDERWQTERFEGVQRAVRQLGYHNVTIEPVKREVRWTEALLTQDDGERFAEDLLKQDGFIASLKKTPTCVIAPNDNYGIGILRALQKTDIQPGQEFGVIGFDDDDPAFGHGLSTVRLPLEELAAVAVDMVVDQLNGRQAPLRVCCSPEVVARTSTFRR